MKSTRYQFEQSAISVLSVALPAAAVLMAILPQAAKAQGNYGAMPPAASISEVATPNGMGSVTRAASDGKTLHVLVGRSIYVDTKTRLRRVYVADPNVLSSVTLTPNEIIVTAMTPGVSSLTLLDEAGQAQSYVISSDLDIDGLRAAMAKATRSDNIKVDGSGGRVTLSGTVATDAIADAAVKLASLYSKDVENALTVVPAHPKQVRLEVRILEVDRSKLQQYGVNLFNPGGNTSFLASTTTSQYPSTATLGSASSGTSIGTLAVSNPLNFMLYSAKLNLGATIQDLQSKQILQILAEPTITTISGQKADFLSGGEFPFPMVQPGAGGSAPVVTISFRPYGVKVEFTPVVNEDGTVRLKVAPEVSALDYSNAVSISGFTVPALSTRRAETEVELRSNQSFAISGLLDQRTTDILNKTPGAANIPILGALFKSKNVNHSTTELIVVVTPTVVDPLSETAAPAEPDMPIRPLDTNSFDDSLGRSHNPQPAAPPIYPNEPSPFQKPTAAPAPKVAPAAAVQPAVTVAPQQSTAVNAAPKPQPGPGSIVPAAQTIPATAPTVAAQNPPTTAAATKPGPVPSVSVVEVMAVSHASDAEAAVAALHRRGYNVAINADPQTSLLHLDIGPFANSKDAESMRQRLLLDGYDAVIK